MKLLDHSLLVSFILSFSSILTCCLIVGGSWLKRSPNLVILLGCNNTALNQHVSTYTSVVRITIMLINTYYVTKMVEYLQNNKKYTVIGQNKINKYTVLYNKRNASILIQEPFAPSKGLDTIIIIIFVSKNLYRCQNVVYV